MKFYYTSLKYPYPMDVGAYATKLVDFPAKTGKIENTRPNMLTIIESEPNTALAKPLIDELSETLNLITGSDGRGSFLDWEPDQRAVFVVALQGKEPVGCGALRPVNLEIAEIKRMYAKYPGQGIGQAILKHLEEFALVFEYKKIWLETRVINNNACRFYLKNGYTRIENYGRYIGRDECACFAKILSP